MINFLKKNWFVAVIAVIFLCFTGYYVYETNKDNLPGKKVGGKDVVFTVGDEVVTADDLYDKLYEQYGQQQLYMNFQRAVVDAYVSDAEVRDAVDYYVSYYKYYYSQYYGVSDLDEYYQSYGYQGLEDYLRCQIKASKMFSDYVTEHAEEFADEKFVEEHNPRMISYCLVKFADKDNVTEDDQNRLAAAQAAWSSDEYNADNFAEFCKKYSEDSTSAPNGGVLGYVDVDSSLVPEFLEAALELKAGECSDWVYGESYDSSTGSYYGGWWVIKCDSTDIKDYKADDGFTSAVLSGNDDLALQILWERAQQLAGKDEIKFPNEDVKNYIYEQLGIKESEEK